MADKIQNGTTIDAVNKSTRLLCKLNKSWIFTCREFLQMIPMISKLVATDVTPTIVRIDKNGIDSSTFKCSGTVGFSVILDFQTHQVTLLAFVFG